MSIRSTALMARKSLRARLGRTIAIGFAIVAGVSFVVGSFVLADSLKATFDNLFAEVNAGVDLEVRAVNEYRPGLRSLDMIVSKAGAPSASGRVCR